MFKKWIAAFSLLFSGAVLLASDVVIEKAVPMSNEGKTSLVVFYKGAPQLSYFALDVAEGVFSVDFPGANSAVDFSELVFPQASRIVQEPLDTDSESGIRVRFFLNGTVNCSVYDGAEGEITLFFKGEAAAETAIAAVAPTNEEVEALPQSAQPMVTQLEGGEGLKRLVHLDVADQQTFGVLRLEVVGLNQYRTFYLKEPNRFVIDLENTLVRVTQPTIAVDSELVQQIRVRQFQREPSPITRCVLDLGARIPVAIRETQQGLALVYGADDMQLAQAVRMLEKGAVDLKQNAEAEVVETAVALQQPAVADEAEAQHVEVVPPMESTTVADMAPVSEPSDDQAVADDANDVTAEVIAADTTATDKVETVTDEVETVVATKESLPAVDETEVNPVVEEPATEVVAATPAATLPTFTEAAETVTETAEAGSRLPVFEEAMDAMADFQNSKQKATPRSLPEPIIDEVDDSMPSFQMASDFDEEVNGVLAADRAGHKQTLYQMMRDQRSSHHEIGTIVVTNNAIDSSKLVEMRPMIQDDEEGDSRDFASLFEENDDPYETIDGGEVEYRGEEISIIDVKDADVVDLLRFIADQVGINLYVDSSVRDVRATYRFRNIPWDQALDIILTNANLDKQFKNGVLRVATTDKFRAEEEARAELRLQRELSVPPVTVTFPLSYANAKEVVPIVEEYLSPRGTILMDERTNTLIIEDIPKRMTAIRTLIKKLDKMISQVTIEARIVESSRRFLRELGVQWGLSGDYSPEIGTDTGLDFPNRVGVGGPTIGTTNINGLQGGYAVNFPVVSENPSGIGLSLGNFLDNFKLDISLQMLENDGEGQIISAPKVTTQNNKTASIKNGQKIPIQTVQRGTVTTTFIDAVLELHVTPHITADETIILDVKVDKSQADFSRSVNGNPVISIRQAETRLLVRNGGTAVIGGIFTLNEQSSASGIPKLRNVPFLKRLFGFESEQYENQELLIFITPKIVKY